MAVLNRTLDVSEQRKLYIASAAATGTGVTGIITFVANGGTIDAAQVAAFGLSGAPTVTIVNNRFIVGTGSTAITIGAAVTVPAFGTSGIPVSGYSLNASGSTLLNVLPGDVLMYQTGGANSAVTGLSVAVVLKPLQDVRKFFGLV